MYRGIVPTICGIAPYVGLNFAVYETLKGMRGEGGGGGGRRRRE